MKQNYVTVTLYILCTADDTSLAIADDLLRYDWLGQVRLIIIRTVRHQRRCYSHCLSAILRVRLLSIAVRYSQGPL